jgi:hypothetical protein
MSEKDGLRDLAGAEEVVTGILIRRRAILKLKGL